MCFDVFKCIWLLDEGTSHFFQVVEEEEEEEVIMQEVVLGDMVGVSGDIKPFRRHFILTGT